MFIFYVYIFNSLSSFRQKLQNLLECSSLYRVNVLLSKIGNLELFNEIAILYGKVREN